MEEQRKSRDQKQQPQVLLPQEIPPRAREQAPKQHRGTITNKSQVQQNRHNKNGIQRHRTQKGAHSQFHQAALCQTPILDNPSHRSHHTNMANTSCRTISKVINNRKQGPAPPLLTTVHVTIIRTRSRSLVRRARDQVDPTPQQTLLLVLMDSTDMACRYPFIPQTTPRCPPPQAPVGPLAFILSLQDPRALIRWVHPVLQVLSTTVRQDSSHHHF